MIFARRSHFDIIYYVPCFVLLFCSVLFVFFFLFHQTFEKNDRRISFESAFLCDLILDPCVNLVIVGPSMPWPLHYQMTVHQRWWWSGTPRQTISPTHLIISEQGFLPGKCIFIRSYLDDKFYGKPFLLAQPRAYADTIKSLWARYIFDGKAIFIFRCSISLGFMTSRDLEPGLALWGMKLAVT